MGVVNAVLINFNFDALITIDVFLLMFPYVLIFLTVMIMRVKEPDAPRSFRVPLPTWALGVWVAFPIAIAIIALFVNGMDWMIGGLAGILTGPIAYLIFKNIYKGTTDDALEGSTLTPTGELTEFGATGGRGGGMKGQRFANLTAITGIIAGAFAIGGGLYARSIEPVFGIPQFFGIYSDYLSGVHVLVGLGIVMVVGGLLSFKWPSVGGIIVCVGRDARPHLHLRPRAVPLDPVPVLLVGPVAVRLDLRHLRRLRGVQERAAERREARRRAARGGHGRLTLTRFAGAHERPGPPRGGPGRFRVYASSRIVTGPSLTRSTCMCAPNTPVATGTPSARRAST